MSVDPQYARRHPCEVTSLAVRQCHANHGIQGEDCVREELTEKRCYAELLCRREAARFYYDPIAISNTGRATCSTLLEQFAFPENDLLLPAEGVREDQRKQCRQVVHDLATCMSKHTRNIRGI